jgi:hypothetical protein
MFTASPTTFVPINLALTGVSANTDVYSHRAKFSS